MLGNLALKIDSLSIVIVSDDFLPAKTGVGTHLQCIVKALVKRGHSVAVMTSRRPDQAEVEDYFGAKVYRSKSICIQGFWLSQASKSEVRRILEAHKPHVVHFHYLSKLLLTALSVCKQREDRVMFTYHMPPEVLSTAWYMKPFKPLIRWLHDRYINDFELIVSPSKMVAEKLIREGVTTKISHISNPLTIEPKKSAQIKPLQSKSLKVLFAGRFAPEKNLFLLIDAFALLISRAIDAELNLAGAGELMDSLKNRAQEKGISDKVNFLGHLDQKKLAEYYLSCDLFVLPSIMEIQSLVLLEAMAAGKPVIATTSITAGPEMIDHDKNGYLVDPHDPKDLADRLEYLALHPEKLKAMGEASLEKVKESSEDQVIDKLIACYWSL